MLSSSFVSVGQLLTSGGSMLAESAANSAISQARGVARGAVNQAANAALSRVPTALRTLAGGVLSGAMARLGLGGAFGGNQYSEPEDFAALRQLNRRLVQTEFIQDWNFRLEIEGTPDDFDLYVKDISYSCFEIGTDEEKLGASTYTWPVSDQPVRVSFTARDNYDRRIFKFLHEWRAQVVGGRDGTVGLPLGSSGYVRSCGFYNIKSSGEEVPDLFFLCYPIQCGEVTRSHDNCAFMEMPVTLATFK